MIDPMQKKVTVSKLGSAQNQVTKLLALADVQINGTRSFDIHVTDPRFYDYVLSGGSMGFGNSYVEGWFECDALDECIKKILIAQLDKVVARSAAVILAALSSKIFNKQSRRRAFEVGEKHYDLGNDLYELMLGKSMMYTCAYWKNAKNLDEAQEAKLDLVCRKIGLKKGDRVLELGCGWGGFAKYAALKYGAEVEGYTVSKEQVAWAEENCKGLPVKFHLQDYRDATGEFDHVVSIGLIEHVGPKNYGSLIEVARRCLKDNGLFLLHGIGSDAAKNPPDPWIEKYIFPNGQIPTRVELSGAMAGKFIVEDWHNFGPDYDKTLMAWYENCEKNWSKLGAKYDERFKRMWRYYLLSCAGVFRSRRSQLWQIVLSKNGVPGGYISIR